MGKEIVNFFPLFVSKRINEDEMFVFFFLGAIAYAENSHEAKEYMQSKPIEIVASAHTDSLMSIKGVVGVGIGELNGKPCIKVMLDKKTRRLVKQIPKSLEGYPVVIEETGEFKARRRTPRY